MLKIAKFFSSKMLKIAKFGISANLFQGKSESGQIVQNIA